MSKITLTNHRNYQIRQLDFLSVTEITSISNPENFVVTIVKPHTIGPGSDIQEWYGTSEKNSDDLYIFKARYPYRFGFDSDDKPYIKLRHRYLLLNPFYWLYVTVTY